MGKIWVNKANSFKAAENFESDYYLKMDALKRLDTVQLLRKWYFKIKRGRKYENREGLRRIIKVI
jgi:hypothetical protein